MNTQKNSGTFGVVQSVSCNNGINTKEKKFRNVNTATKEKVKYDELKLGEIDPEQNYFIRPKTCVKTRKNNISNLNKSIFYINGGNNLYKLLNNIEEDAENNEANYNKIKEYLLRFRNIIKGIQILHENNIFHFDIKPQNIVYNGDKKGIKENDKKMRLIDFGGSLKIEDKTQHTITLNSALKLVGENASTTFTYAPLEFLGNIAKYRLFIKKINNNNNKNNLTTIKTKPYYIGSYYIGSYDIWSLGMTLINIYETLQEIFIEKTQNAEHIKKIETELLNLIKNILIADYTTRPNASKVLELYDAFLKRVSIK